MRILEVVHGFPPAALGGSEIYAEAHARALQEHGGDDVLVLTREHDPNRAEYDVRAADRDGLRVLCINNTFRDTRTFEDTYRNEAIGAIAARVIDEFKPDVAHVHHLTCLSTTIVRSLADRRIPCFLTLHDYWLLCHRGQLLDVDYRVCDGPDAESGDACHACLGPAGGAGALGFAGALTMRALERRLPAAPAQALRQVAERASALVFSNGEAKEQERRRIAHMREVCAGVTHFLAPSRYMRDRFVRFGVPPEKITVTGYGIDHARFPIRLKPDPTSHRTWGPPSGGPLRLGFLGSLMASKAPHLLLEAIGHLPPGSVSVDLYGGHVAYHGDDGYREQLEPLLRQAGVRLHGAIEHERVAGALSSIDVLVVPSIWPENSPLVILEAFRAGLPVVASRIGGIPEVVADGENGLLFCAGDSVALAGAIARLLQEPGLLDTLRAGIPPVRSIEDDVRFARSLYQEHRTQRSQSAQSQRCSSIAALSPVSAQRIAAVVLNFRTPDETLLAVKSLLASRRPIDDLIVVDNDSSDAGGAGDDIRDALKGVWPRISYIDTGSNLGFSGGMNVGIREALDRGAGRVLLVNSDVIVPPDAVERLEESLDAAPHAGIAGPVVLSRSEPDTIASLGMSYTPFTGRMRHGGAGLAGSRADFARAKAGRAVDGVSGCAMLVRREVFEAVGLLEEDYFFGFEDLDFCLKARRSGFATILADRATIYHEGSQSLGPLSVRRFYFAARNHLLLARRADPSAGRIVSLFRGCSIVLLNLGHAVVSRGGSLPARAAAVIRGTRDYLGGRFGSGL